jgi:hypothetical protein
VSALVHRNASERIPIEPVVAAAYLRATSVNNATGLIGGPYTPVGYTLSGALRLLDAATEVYRGYWHGQETVQAVLPTGEHVWYLRINPPYDYDADPWTDPDVLYPGHGSGVS